MRGKTSVAFAFGLQGSGGFPSRRQDRRAWRRTKQDARRSDSESGPACGVAKGDTARAKAKGVGSRSLKKETEKKIKISPYRKG